MMKTWSLPEEMNALPYERAVPIGLTQDGKSVVYDGRRLPYLNVMAADVEVLDVYLSGLCKYFDGRGFSYKVLDGARAITKYQSPHIICPPEDIEFFVLKLEKMLPVCKYIIIVNISQTLELLSSGTEAKLVDYIVKGHTSNRPIAIVASELWRYETMKRLELRGFLSSQRRGLWIGHSVQECPFRTSDSTLKDRTWFKEPWMGYLFAQGDVCTVHVLGTGFSEYEALENGRVSDSMDSIQELEAGLIVADRYLLVSQIGEGGGHIVWLVKDLRLKTMWAMKTLRVNALYKSLSIATQDLRNEAYLMASLSHPAIPRVIDVVQYGSLVCVILDNMRGMSISAFVRNQSVIDEALCFRIGVELCEALKALHKQSPPLIHGDIKPANVILREDSGVALVDFSSARRIGDPCSYVPVTMMYAAPELLSGSVLSDVRLDIYGVGLILYVLATGERLQGRPRPLRSICSRISRGLEHVVMRATAQHIVDRYCSIDELLEDLIAYAPAGWESPWSTLVQGYRWLRGDDLRTPYIDDDQDTIGTAPFEHGII